MAASTKNPTERPISPELLQELKDEVQLEFLKRLYEILQSKELINKAVKEKQVVKLDNQPITLTEADLAFEHDGEKNESYWKNVPVSIDRRILEGTDIPLYLKGNLTLRERVVFEAVFWAAAADVTRLGKTELQARIDKKTAESDDLMPPNGAPPTRSTITNKKNRRRRTTTT